MQISQVDEAQESNDDGASTPSTVDINPDAEPATPVEIIVRNSEVVLDGSTPTLLIDGSNSHSVRIPVGSFPAHTLMTLDRFEAKPSLLEGSVLHSDVVILNFNDTATGHIVVNMKVPSITINRRSASEASPLHLHWLDQVQNTWKGVCSNLRDSNIVSAQVKMEVLNDRSFAASSEECHSELVDICGTSKGGVLAVLSRDNDNPCQQGSDSGSGGVAAGVVVSIFLVGIAAAGVYYKFYMKRGSQSLENKEQDDEEQNDSVDRTKDHALVEEATRQCKAIAS